MLIGLRTHNELVDEIGLEKDNLKKMKRNLLSILARL
jgi:hypothetical protein